MTTIDFENVRPSLGAEILNGYEGLKWRNFGDQAPGDDTFGTRLGYMNAVTSGKYIAYDGWGEPAVISAHTAFTVESGYFTAAWDEGLRVRFVGFSGGERMAVQTVVMGQDRVFVEFGPAFSGIDRFRISTSGGHDADPNDIGQGTNFAMDDLTFHFDDPTVGAPVHAPALVEPAHSHRHVLDDQASDGQALRAEGFDHLVV